MLLQLSESQLLALEVLAAAGTYGQAAAAAGVHEKSVARWSRHHPAFRAAREELRAELAERISDAVQRCSVRAVEVVTQAIDDGDAAAALNWLRFVAPPPELQDGPCEPVAVLRREAATMRPRPSREELRVESESMKRACDGVVWSLNQPGLYPDG